MGIARHRASAVLSQHSTGAGDDYVAKPLRVHPPLVCSGRIADHKRRRRYTESRLDHSRPFERAPETSA
jgi:hypothetical protein